MSFSAAEVVWVPHKAVYTYTCEACEATTERTYELTMGCIAHVGAWQVAPHGWALVGGMLFCPDCPVTIVAGKSFSVPGRKT